MRTEGPLCPTFHLAADEKTGRERLHALRMSKLARNPVNGVSGAGLDATDPTWILGDSFIHSTNIYRALILCPALCASVGILQ